MKPRRFGGAFLFVETSLNRTKKLGSAI